LAVLPAPGGAGITSGQKTGAARCANRALAVGLPKADTIGGKLIELNVFSTGGLFDAERFCGVSFVDRIIEAVEARVAAHREASTPPSVAAPPE